MTPEELAAIPLENCAHCAGTAKMEEVEFRYAVYCQDKYCGICTPLCSTPTWAAKYWNRRDGVKPKE